MLRARRLRPTRRRTARLLIASSTLASARPLIAAASLAAALGASSAAAAAAPQARIVGGTPTTIKQVPWQVSVWSNGGTHGGFSCGGTIIDSVHIVTAAHCVDGATIGNDPWSDGGLGVTAGISHLTAELPADDPQDRVVVDARVHPMWNADVVQTSGDLAVLELDEPLTLGGAPGVATAKAIALPPDLPIGDDPALVGKPVRVSGFGRQTSILAPSGQLFSLDTVVDSPSICGGYDNAAALCARTPAGAACSGDSGGPLVTSTNPPILVGVVSNGPVGCPAGEGESYVNLATPENRRFLAGIDNPPIAPRQLDEVTFDAGGALASVGQPVTCTASFTGNPTTKWSITNDANVSVGGGTGGNSFVYRPTESDVGHLLSCTVTAANAGGVAMAGPAVTDTPVLRPLNRGGSGGTGGTTGGTTTPPPTTTPFQLNQAVMAATAPKSVKRGKVIAVKVALTSLAAAAEQATVCVKLDTAKPKCVTPVVKGQQAATVSLRFRISKRARVKALLTFDVSVGLAGHNPTSKLIEQINRMSTVRARVTR